MNISAYILEYLKQLGSVTVPGFGVFSLENSKAIINSENGSILPPASQIAFISDYEILSDELAIFISSQKQMSLDTAKSDLKIQTDFWKKKLQADQMLEILNLGTIIIQDSDIQFKGQRIESGHPNFYGLEEIKISDIKNTQTSSVSEKSGKDYKVNISLLWILLIVIPVLGLLYLAFTQQELLFGKKSFEKEIDSIKTQTKTPQIVKDTLKMKAQAPEIKISDSLKKDSMVNLTEKEVEIQKTQKQQ